MSPKGSQKNSAKMDRYFEEMTKKRRGEETELAKNIIKLICLVKYYVKNKTTSVMKKPITAKQFNLYVKKRKKYLEELQKQYLNIGVLLKDDLIEIALECLSLSNEQLPTTKEFKNSMSFSYLFEQIVPTMINHTNHKEFDIKMKKNETVIIDKKPKRIAEYSFIDQNLVIKKIIELINQHMQKNSEDAVFSQKELNLLEEQLNDYMNSCSVPNRKIRAPLAKLVMADNRRKNSEL